MVPAEKTDAVISRLKSRADEDDDSIDPAFAALDIASLSLDGEPIEPYRRHLETLCQDVKAFAGRSTGIDAAAEALKQIIGRRYGYGGNKETFDDLDAANLMRVIDERSGLPVALGILYIHVARNQGWQACGVDFPGRFLIRIDVDGERAILNPFAGGTRMRPRDLRDTLKLTMGAEAELLPEHYRILGNRGILMRLENNLKVRHLHARRFSAALEAVETMLLLSPGEASLWREAGMIHVKLEQTAEAIAALEEYLRLDTGGDSRYTAGVLLQELRSRRQ